MKVKLGRSSIYSADGITIIPKLVREYFKISHDNYKEFEVCWYLDDGKVVLEINRIEVRR